MGLERRFCEVRNSGLILGGGFGKICASLDGKSRVRRNGRGQDIVRELIGSVKLLRVSRHPRSSRRSRKAKVDPPPVEAIQFANAAKRSSGEMLGSFTLTTLGRGNA